MEQKLIEVPEDWLQDLLNLAYKVDKAKGVQRETAVALLLGYISSAQTIIKPAPQHQQ
jgi:hypothetical protein